MSKTYNPFKMLGSYIGVAVLNFIQYFRLSSTTATTFIGKIISKIPLIKRFGDFPERIILDNFFTTQSLNEHFVLAMFLIFSLTTIFGFLIGWLIHILIRRFK